jgi:sporulation protein YlmC with PRC-barrel domain
MLRNASAIKGYAIAASDGRLGTVSDFLFDDENWLVRWLVVDTGKWLSGRKVLLPPSVLGHLDPKGEEFPVELTMQQVKDSPEVDTEQSVSRQMESKVYDYYGWSPYWGTGFYMGGYGYPGGAGMIGGPGYIGGGVAPSALGSRQDEEHGADNHEKEGDPHLRSTAAVTGYHIHASDGEIGHVEDFLLEDADWSIRYLLVDTKNWWPGKKVLISPRSIHEIDWTDKLVNLDVNRQRVKDSPAYDASIGVERGYDEKFLTY